MHVAVCVCVQVVRDINRLKLDPSGEPVEALLTRDLKHRSMMKTLAHAWWMATDRGGAGGEQQCWMLLEYCDKGSIVVSRTKGGPGGGGGGGGFGGRVEDGLIRGRYCNSDRGSVVVSGARGKRGGVGGLWRSGWVSMVLMTLVVVIYAHDLLWFAWPFWQAVIPLHTPSRLLDISWCLVTTCKRQTEPKLRAFSAHHRALAFVDRDEAMYANLRHCDTHCNNLDRNLNIPECKHVRIRRCMTRALVRHHSLTH